MPVIAAYLYRHGRRVRDVSIEERIDCPTDKSECKEPITCFMPFSSLSWMAACRWGTPMQMKWP